MKYLIEYRDDKPMSQGGHDFITFEGAVPTSEEGVFQAFDEAAVYDVDAVLVTQISDDAPARDVTADMLHAYVEYLIDGLGVEQCPFKPAQEYFDEVEK